MTSHPVSSTGQRYASPGFGCPAGSCSGSLFLCLYSPVLLHPTPRPSLVHVGSLTQMVLLTPTAAVISLTTAVHSNGQGGDMCRSTPLDAVVSSRVWNPATGSPSPSPVPMISFPFMPASPSWGFQLFSSWRGQELPPTSSSVLTVRLPSPDCAHATRDSVSSQDWKSEGSSLLAKEWKGYVPGLLGSPAQPASTTA